MAADPERELIEDIAGFFADPLGFVLYVFPWGEEGTPLADESGPDSWQVDVLTALGEAIERGESNAAVAEAIRVAVASGHGIGKSALVAWIILWFISTREHPQIVVTANTKEQLNSKTWRELAKWHQLALIKHWFAWTATRFHHVAYPETWFAAAIPWTEHNSEAFAGTHEKYVLIVFDEASAIADVIWEVGEGAMTTPGAMWVAFGNPTKNTGRFRECFGRFKHRWLTRQIDSRTAKKANRAEIDKWVEDYGEDSDFIRIRVRGVFPRAGSTQFISSEVVERCRKLDIEEDAYEHMPVLLGVDVARFGDDQSVLTLRQGRKVWPQLRFRGLRTNQLAAQVVRTCQQMAASGKPVKTIFVDVVGIGAGVADALVALNYGDKLIEVNAGESPHDGQRYFNKRAEMWGLMREYLASGADIPDDTELEADLVAPEYGYTTSDKIQLEKKEDMKKRGLASPDSGDSLALTFAEPTLLEVETDMRPEWMKKIGKQGRGGFMSR